MHAPQHAHGHASASHWQSYRIGRGKCTGYGLGYGAAQLAHPTPEHPGKRLAGDGDEVDNQHKRSCADGCMLRTAPKGEGTTAVNGDCRKLKERGSGSAELENRAAFLGFCRMTANSVLTKEASCTSCHFSLFSTLLTVRIMGAWENRQEL
jgi:hypothetical protein